MKDDFRKKLSENGQSVKWFYDKFIKEKIGLTYSGFAAQLNGYAPISSDVKTELDNYIKKTQHHAS